jgi:hypothetical protein
MIGGHHRGDESFIVSGARCAVLAVLAFLVVEAISFALPHNISTPREAYNQSSPVSRPIRVTSDLCEPSLW